MSSAAKGFLVCRAQPRNPKTKKAADSFEAAAFVILGGIDERFGTPETRMGAGLQLFS
jgi:hypothetical protein